jgi:hypothetical protein
MTRAAGECLAGGFAHRWSTGYSVSLVGHGCEYCPLWRVQENHHRGGLEGPGTLLGPEETGAETFGSR